jgi:hypothetical protein
VSTASDEAEEKKAMSDKSHTSSHQFSYNPEEVLSTIL